MAKLARVMARIERRLNRLEAMIVFATGWDGEGDFLEAFEEAYTPAPPPARSELKGSQSTLVETSKPADDGGEVLASKGAIDLAKEAGIDLASVVGTGAEGKVIKPDVQKAIKASEE